jgi:hypothetical protein
MARRTSAAKRSGSNSAFSMIVVTKPFSLARSSAVICLAVTTRIGMRAVSGCAERFHHVEAVHLRHHQIEHDQVRQLPPRDVDRLRPPYARRTVLPSRDADGDELHRLRDRRPPPGP